MKSALVIPAQGEPYKTEITDDSELEQLQKLVGGWIEYVPVCDEEGEVLFSVFCHEEGKIEGLPLNGRANHFFKEALLEEDHLVGDIVLMGPPDDDGETLALDHADAWLKEALAVTEIDLRRWADWKDLRARKEIATTDAEKAELTLEEEALRQRGINEVLEKDMGQREQWWWLSFADPGKPTGEQFLGVIIVLAGGIGEATQKLWDMGINPGGEVRAYPIPEEHVPDEQYRNKLLSREELEEAELA